MLCSDLIALIQAVVMKEPVQHFYIAARRKHQRYRLLRQNVTVAFG